MLSAQTRFDVINVQTLQSPFGSETFSDYRDVIRLASSGLCQWINPINSLISVSDAAGWQQQKVIKENSLTPLRNAWRKHVVDVTAPINFEHIGETIDGVYNLIEIGGPGELDMSGLDSQATNGEHLVAALRAAYRWRNEVPSWSEARDVARCALLRERHADVELCLAGLE